MGEELVQYVNRIDETLLPFGGRFLVHGGTAELLEGNWNSDLVINSVPGPRARSRLVHFRCLSSYPETSNAKLGRRCLSD